MSKLGLAATLRDQFNPIKIDESSARHYTQDAGYANCSDFVRLPVGDTEVDLSPYLGNTVALEYSGKIFCIECGQRRKRALIKALFPLSAQVCLVRHVHC
ncbi:MAG: hypothetical protein CM1200mP41_34340 [Gammaproteobacteria bacterium]|nr:MAG: hypothetical protein CM1200mP41_34340 [Gammaproteobacteria bacterium]